MAHRRKKSNLAGGQSHRGSKKEAKAGGHHKRLSHIDMGMNSWSRGTYEALTIGCYQLGDQIGKGGFGSVYRCLNLQNGQTVAIKRLDLGNLPKEELGGIKGEIRLLQSLQHENIVKYIDTIMTDGYLNIVLEYVENGALSQIVSKFGGAFPESLVALYISQVLKGLVYLHGEGVIHRDIKGANILATKDGVMKLADFGVATQLTEFRKSDSVVGTPYWMAPEIIEMSGHMSTACDIWSVGCTTVELMCGAPPYFDLNPMPALFRIVQDEHPPLPPGISPALNDFLLQCFQKDPNLRISAEHLLKHPWLRASATAVHQNQAFAQKIHSRPGDDQQAEMLRKTIKMNAKEFSFIQEEARVGISLKAPAVSKSKRHSILEAELTPLILDIDSDESDGLSDFDDFGARPNGTKSDTVQNAKSPRSDTDTVTNIEKVAHQIQADMMIEDPKQNLMRFQESDDDDDDDFGLEIEGTVAISALIDNKGTSWDRASDSEEEMDGFTEFDVFSEAGFDDSDTQSNEKAVRSAEVLNLINTLTPKQTPDKVIKACERLLEIFQDDQSQIGRLLSTHGVIPIMEMMEVSSDKVLLTILKVVNQIVTSDVKFMHSLCLVGLIPAIYRLIQRKHPTNIRQEAGRFVKKFLSPHERSKDFTRKMFIACGGLSALVHFLDGDYELNKELMAMGVDCISLVFDTSNHPKNDFCRLFSKFGLLRPLVLMLNNCAKDNLWQHAPDYARKVSRLFLMFSEGDSTVKGYMARRNVLKALLALTSSLGSDRYDVLVYVVKAIRNLSMDAHILDDLEDCGAIQRLIPLMTSPFPDIQNQVIQSMYYILQIKQSRQEKAAKQGIIPHLQRIIRQNHPLREFAFPMICKLAHASKRTLFELKKHDGINFYMELLQQHHWQIYGLEAIAVWLMSDTSRVEIVLLQSDNIVRLLTVFQCTQKKSFEMVLQSFINILRTSMKLNRHFGNSVIFIDMTAERLREHSDALVRKQLLVLVQVLFEQHEHRKDSKLGMFIKRLLPVLQTLAASDRILVRGLAETLLKEFGKYVDVAQ